mmetsp:Transcript_20243/g.24534  ORF Transcript_20243/g.24534 Transcript_20243/m.24534 type:complete len:107 (+) Transcript_20243:34-354(+)
MNKKDDYDLSVHRYRRVIAEAKEMRLKELEKELKELQFKREPFDLIESQLNQKRLQMKNEASSLKSITLLPKTNLQEELSTVKNRSGHPRAKYFTFAYDRDQATSN